ncbi:hypothetical protein LTR08_004552 [Meristemomyces frigidus]|nr:hypothetical protein LTR08_004552 [Meristemomyces frigidus]
MSDLWNQQPHGQPQYSQQLYRQQANQAVPQHTQQATAYQPTALPQYQSQTMAPQPQQSQLYAPTQQQYVPQQSQPYGQLPTAQYAPIQAPPYGQPQPYPPQQAQPYEQPQPTTYAPQQAQPYVTPQQAQHPQIVQQYVQQQAQPYEQPQPTTYAPQQSQPYVTPQQAQHPQLVQQYVQQQAQPYGGPSYGQQQGLQTLSQGQQISSVTTTKTMKEEVVRYGKSKQQSQQPAVIQALAPQPPTIDYDALKVKALPETKQQTSTKTEVTKRTKAKVTGGQHRQAAAAKGAKQLKRFDEEVNRMLVAGSSMCPAAFRYYRTDKGYLCGGGSHWASNHEVDAMMDGRRPFGANIETVNAPGFRYAQPPDEAWHEPMQQSAALAWASRMCTTYV